MQAWQFVEESVHFEQAESHSRQVVPDKNQPSIQELHSHIFPPVHVVQTSLQAKQVVPDGPPKYQPSLHAVHSEMRGPVHSEQAALQETHFPFKK